MSNTQKKEKTQIGIIGIPHTGTFPWQTTMSILSLKLPVNTIVKYHLVGSCLIYDARDKIINFAEKQNADWVLFFDSDMIVPADSIIKFINTRLEGKELDVVGGICFKRTPPFQPCFYTKARIDAKTKKPVLESPIDFPEKGLLSVEGLGMACTFIRKKAWRAIKEKTGHCFFPFPGVGEDLSFCIRARMADIKMFVDLSINVGHVAQIDIRKEHFFAAKQEHMEKYPDKPLFNEV